MMHVELRNTILLIAQSWTLAEAKLQNKLERIAPDADEEFITRDFHSHFAETLMVASERKQIEHAFLADIKAAFQWGNEPEGLEDYSAGLIADVRLHHKGTERKTGGDLGLLISGPKITNLGGGSLHRSEVQHGLLCQAKLRSAAGKWRKLTPTQIKVLPNRLAYSALLLYNFSDSERRKLEPFSWQVCQSASQITEVTSWLKSGLSPSIQSSAQLIRRLGLGELGTSDPEIIAAFIAPAGNTCLEIKIDWPDGKRPESLVLVHSQSHQMTIAVKISR